MRYYFTLFCTSIVLIPFVISAQTNASEYVPLVGIPGLSGNNLNVNTYIQALYILAISLAAFGAVIRLIIAGIKYILSDVVTDKSSAKKDIQNALIGLGIVIGAVLILNTINPQLTQLNALSMQPVSFQVQGPRAEVVNQLTESAVIRAGDRQRSCQGRSATDCESLCNEVSGQVITTGIISEQGEVIKNSDRPVCLIRNNSSENTTDDTPTDTTVGLENISTDVEYSRDEQNNFIRLARDLGNFVSTFNTLTNTSQYNDPNTACQQQGADTGYLLRGEGQLTQHVVLCVNN